MERLNKFIKTSSFLSSTAIILIQFENTAYLMANKNFIDNTCDLDKNENINELTNAIYNMKKS